MKKALILSIVALFVLFGCTLPGSAPAPPVNQTQVVAPTAPVVNPSFQIVGPTDGQTISIQNTSSDITLTLSTSNLVLQAAGGAANVGQGHFSVTVDGGDPVDVTSTQYTMANLGLGQHTVEVELMNNDDTPYIGQTRQVSFTIESEAPQVYQSQNYQVNITNGQYSPDNLTTQVTDTVTFVNQDARPSSAEAVANGVTVFDTHILSQGQNATVTMTTPGNFTIYSPDNPTLSGEIQVVSSGQ